jgi:hypothetical protein
MKKRISEDRINNPINVKSITLSRNFVGILISKISLSECRFRRLNKNTTTIPNKIPRIRLK